MPEDIVPVPLGEVKVASTAGGGTALTTAASFTSLYPGTTFIRMVPRNVVTAAVIRYAFNPWLVVFKTTDALATVANMPDGSANVQDNDTATSLSMNAFNTFANGNALFVGSLLPFRGVRVIIGDTNSVGASDLAVKYRKDDDTWANITPSDGTDDTDTFRQTGNVTWTVPTDWKADSIRHIQNLVGTWLAADMDATAGAVTLPDETTLPTYIADNRIYWTRWETSAVFDGSVTVTGMQSMNRSTTYDELEISLGMEMRVHNGLDGIGCIEHLVDAGTANLIISCGVIGSRGKFG